MALVRLAGIDDHAEESFLLPNKEDPHLGPDAAPEGHQAPVRKSTEEPNAKVPRGPETAVPVWTNKPAVTVNMLELLIGETKKVRISEDCSHFSWGCLSNISWRDRPIISKKSQLVPSEAGDRAGSRLINVTGPKKLVNGLSRGKCRRRAVGGDPSQNSQLHRLLARRRPGGSSGVRRPKSGLLWAGSGNSTLVENQEGVPGAAEAMPPGRKPQEQLPMAEITSSRWGPHLWEWQREDVARHVRQSSMELYFHALSLLLVGPE